MDWQWKTKREVHRTRREGQQLAGLARLHARGRWRTLHRFRHHGSRAIDELTERAKHPQPPPLTAENIRTLLRDADERFMRDLELRGSSRADDRASTGVDDDATDSEG